VGKHARIHGPATRFAGGRIAFSPPRIITAAEIDEVVVRVTPALDDAWAEIPAAG
jgi:4-aminobutyrate---pyruvate transaminase